MSDSKAARIGRIALVIAAFILGAARHWVLIDARFGDSTDDSVTITYVGRVVQNWERFGFRELKGIPVLSVYPTMPPSSFLEYINHPPLNYWTVYGVARLMGRTERAMRIFPAAMSAIATALFVLLVARRTSLIVATMTLLVLLVDRMGFFMGWMASYESPVLAFMLMALVLHDRARRTGTRWPIAVVLWIGILYDWPAAFMAPMLLAHELTWPKPERRLRATLLAIVVGGAAAALTMAAIYLYWKGSIGETLATIARNAGTTLQASSIPSFGAWLLAQGRFLTVNFGWGLTLLSGVALPWMVARCRRDALAAFVLCLWIPGLLNVCVFFRRSYDHEYWWYYGLIGVVGSAAWAMSRLWSIRRLFALILCLALVGEGVWMCHRHWKTTDRVHYFDLARKVNLFLGSEDVLVVPFVPGAQIFYARCFLHGSFNRRIATEEILSTWRAGRFGTRRVAIYVPDWLLAEDPAPFESLPNLDGITVLTPPQSKVFILQPR